MPPVHALPHAAILTLLTGLVSGAALPAVAGHEPGAAYNFDRPGANIARDASGNGHHGKVCGDVSSCNGVHGRAFLGNGRDARIEIADDPTLDAATGHFTVCAWINVHRLSGKQQMVVGKNVYSANQREWGLLIEANGTVAFYVWNKTWHTVSTQAWIEPGKWTHLVAVIDGDASRVYVDGRLVGEKRTGPLAGRTPAPVSIGGIGNARHPMQHFAGAIDEVRIYNVSLSTEEIEAMQIADLPRHPVEETARPKVFKLWDGDLPPDEVALPFVPGTRFAIIKKRTPDTDGYKWLHGVALAQYKGALFASWGANKGAENTPTEELLYSRSTDGGRTWSRFGTIAGAADGVGHSHGAFLVHDDVLWSFAPCFGKGTGRFPGLAMEAWTFDARRNAWQPKGKVGSGVWPLRTPQQLVNGAWIVSGCDANWRAAVAVTDGDDLLRWRTVDLPVGDRILSEATLWVDGPEVIAILRNQSPLLPGPIRAAVCISTDSGRTWSAPMESNFPMVTSKPYAGTLSTGQRYLVCNACRTNSNCRSTLIIVVGRPGEKHLCRIWRLDAGMGLSYPYAIEHDGALYVGYSWTETSSAGNQNSAKLAVLPLAALAVH